MAVAESGFEHVNDDMRLCQVLRAALPRSGFATIDRITDLRDIQLIRELVQQAIANARDDCMHDLGDDGEISEDPQIFEVVSPSRMSPQLLQTKFFQRALSISRALLGPAARLLFDHCVIKPPFNKTATAWHQDCGYGRLITFEGRRLHWWLPLQDATLANGCMRFIAGSHLGPVLGHHLRTPRAYARQTELPSRVTPTPCPIKVGGVTIHLPKTLHGSGPNDTAASRAAWIVQIGVRDWIPRPWPRHRIGLTRGSQSFRLYRKSI
jgi:Phytanoyl-CoA dioxygenase (PhyH)